ncbi:MAG: hypoxanthine phosphoribosyltransferase [bacterium]|nr:hypoxanthine phosphoribosyltransferase [bacterium]
MKREPVLLISKEDIQKRVQELAREISKDYRDKKPFVICILKGAWMFMADLVRELKVPVECDFLAVSSYGGETESSGVVKIMADLTRPIEGKDVLIVEDIVDTGLTLRYLKEILLSRAPKSLKICTLLDKPSRRQVKIKLDYVGFEVPDRFVVGYGLDCQEHFRNLPYIAYVEPTNR